MTNPQGGVLYWMDVILYTYNLLIIQSLIKRLRQLLVSLGDGGILLAETCKQLLLGIGLGGVCQPPCRPQNSHSELDMGQTCSGGFGALSNWLSSVGVINQFDYTDRIGVRGRIRLALIGCHTSQSLWLLFNGDFMRPTLTYSFQVDCYHMCEVET